MCAYVDYQSSTTESGIIINHEIKNAYKIIRKGRGRKCIDEMAVPIRVKVQSSQCYRPFISVPQSKARLSQTLTTEGRLSSLI